MNPIEEMMEKFGVTKQDIYPPFTPEKQLEIIKILAKFTGSVTITNSLDEKWAITTSAHPTVYFKNTEDALAYFLINSKGIKPWTQQIKEVLENDRRKS